MLLKKYNWLIFGLLAAVMVIVPLYPKFPLVDIPGTYVEMRLEDLLILMLVVCWGLINLSRWKEILFNPVVLAIILFWSVGALSLFSGIWLTQSVQPGIGLLHFLRRIEVMLLFIVAATSISSVTQVKKLLVGMLIVTVLSSVYGLGQVYLGWPVVTTNNEEFSKGLILKLTPGARPNSTFAGHYDLAIYLSIALTFIAALFWVYKRKLVKLMLMISGLLALGLLALTAARVSFVAMIVGVASVWWGMGKRWLVVLLIIACGVTVMAVPQLRNRVFATIEVNILPAIKSVTKSTPAPTRQPTASEGAITNPYVAQTIVPGEPTTYTELEVYRSFKIRTDVNWPRAINAFKKDPLIGTGYSSISIASDNDYLRSLGEVGLLGTASLLLIFVMIARQLRSGLKKVTGVEKAVLVGSLMMLPVIAVTATFIDVLEASKIATLVWMWLGISWAISRRYQDHKE